MQSFRGTRDKQQSKSFMTYRLICSSQISMHLCHISAKTVRAIKIKHLRLSFQPGFHHRALVLYSVDTGHHQGDFSDHRLNGSSSPVLTATSLSYGKAKNSTPHRIKTPDLIEIKFRMVDYVGEMTPHAKFHVNPFKGGLPGKWVKYTQKFL